MSQAPNTPHGEKKALVLSGGGADGAYAVGVLKALLGGLAPSTGHRPLDPDILVGTSCGAYNAALLTSLWDDYGATSAGTLEAIWLDRLAGPDGNVNGFYRILADPLPFFDPRTWLPNPLPLLGRLWRDTTLLGTDGLQRLTHFATAWDESLEQRFIELFNFSSFVSNEPFEETIRETIHLGKIRTSSKALQIVATDWLSGQLHFFKNSDLSDNLGREIIQASTAIPGFIPPIEVGSQLFVDGGVLLNTPLKPALTDGATELHVVYLDPDISKIPLSHLGNTAETFYRMFQIMWAAAVNADIEDANTINRGLEILAKAARGEVHLEGNMGFLVRLAGSYAARPGGRQYRPLVIHRYHPDEDLGGELGLLNFRRERLARLIEKGFQDTVSHDCKSSGCVLPNIPGGFDGG